MVLDKQYTNLNLIINNKIYVYMGVIIILRSSNVLDNFTRKYGAKLDRYRNEVHISRTYSPLQLRSPENRRVDEMSLQFSEIL